MINIKLNTPVVLLKQIPELASASGKTKEELVSLLRNENCVVTKDYPDIPAGTLVKEKEWKEKGIEEKDIINGSEAILWLCEKAGNEAPSVTEVDIPNAVYYEAPRMWMDISALAAQVETRSRRLQMLTQAKAPHVILINEKRDLMEKVNILEDTSWCKNPPLSESGRMRRCLADVGYSLLDGWSPDMIAEFDRRESEMMDSVVVEENEETAEE